MHEMGGLLLWLPGCSSTEDIFCGIIWKKHWLRDQQLHLKFGSPQWMLARITLIISVSFLVWRIGIKTATHLYPQTVWALKTTCAKAFFFKVESTCSDLSHRHRTNFASREVWVCEAVFHHSCDHRTFIVSQKVLLLVKVWLLIVLLPTGLQQGLFIITLNHGLAFASQ